MTQDELARSLRNATAPVEPPTDLWHRVRARLDATPARATLHWRWLAVACCATVLLALAVQTAVRPDDTDSVRLSLGPDLTAASFLPQTLSEAPTVLDGYRVSSYSRTQKKCAEVEQMVFEKDASNVALFVAPMSVKVSVAGPHPRRQFACGRQTCLLVCPRCSPDLLTSLANEVNNHALTWQ